MNPINVLLVDDDVTVAMTLGAVLELEDYQVGIGHSISEMRALLETKRFDIAIVDLRIGNEDGMQAITVLQDHQPQCMSIVLTGYPTPDSMLAAIRLHVVDFLTKPCDLDQLKEAVLRAKKQADNLRACRACFDEMQRKSSLVDSESLSQK